MVKKVNDIFPGINFISILEASFVVQKSYVLLFLTDGLFLYFLTKINCRKALLIKSWWN